MPATCLVDGCLLLLQLKVLLREQRVLDLVHRARQASSLPLSQQHCFQLCQEGEYLQRQKPLFLGGHLHVLRRLHPQQVEYSLLYSS
jgi:hypothetical protein